MYLSPRIVGETNLREGTPRCVGTLQAFITGLFCLGSRREALISRASLRPGSSETLRLLSLCPAPGPWHDPARGTLPSPGQEVLRSPTPPPRLPPRGWPETRPVVQAAVNQDASAAAPGAGRPPSCPVGILAAPPTRCHGSNPQRQPGLARAEEEGSVPLSQSASISVDVRVPE